MSETADEAYAAKIASFLLASFPQQPAEPAVFLRQLTLLCVGRQKALLQRMVHPIDGILATSKFIPSLAEVRDWLGNTPADAHQRVLPPPPPEPEPQMTDEEIAAADAMWAKVKPLLEETTRAMRANVDYDGKSRLDWTAGQRHSEELLEEALKNLRAMQGGGGA